ncbi:MAG: GNAT family N-acetyltransferase [Burkholderiales bacterium]
MNRLQGSVTVSVGDWPTQREEAIAIRMAVFVREQQLPEADEIDSHDPFSTHALALDAGRAVGTARLLPDARIGRMSVLPDWRRSGVGGLLLERLVTIAAARGDPVVELSAQVYVLDFYARHGFEAFGPIYDDAGIAHQSMQRRLR